MPQETVGEIYPRRGTWVFCILNHDGRYSNLFFSADEADLIVEWIRKIGLTRPEFLRKEFWAEKGSGGCRVDKVYKALRREPLFGNKLRRSFSKFQAKSTRRCVGSCPKSGHCVEILDPVTRRLKSCKCQEQ